MKSWKKPTDELIDRALGSFKKQHHRKYFFRRLENPLWLQPLVERDCFQSPPSVRRFNGYIQFPYWSEIQYLKNICHEVPDAVINLVLGLPEGDNPNVYDGILEIALQLHGEQSVKLKPKMLEYAGIEHQFLMHRFADLLVHWTAENQTSAALELSKALVALAPDLQSANEQNWLREIPEWETLPDPFPQMDTWNYRDLMFKGVRPLAERAPYQVACLLIDAIANMIRLQTHLGACEKKEDKSELWCQRPRESDGDSEEPMAVLVHTLTFACKKVFEKSPDAVMALDAVLRNQHPKIFKRLRQHLYTQYPDKQRN